MMKRGAGFGKFQIGNVKKYGRNFPDGKGFIPSLTWEDQLKAEGWNPVSTAGTVGRELGPEGHKQIYSSKYFYRPRMPAPGGQLDAAIMLNRNCGAAKPPPPSILMLVC